MRHYSETIAKHSRIRMSCKTLARIHKTGVSCNNLTKFRGFEKRHLSCGLRKTSKCNSSLVSCHNKGEISFLVNLLGNTDGISIVVSATVGVNKCRSAVQIFMYKFLSFRRYGRYQLKITNQKFYDTLTRLYVTVSE